MANNPSSAETTPTVDATETDATPHAVAVAPVRATKSPRARWVLSSIAAAGLLCLGLLGGMLIGQHMVPPGIHVDGKPGNAAIHNGGPGQQHTLTSQEEKRVKDEVNQQVKQRLQELRDRKQQGSKPGGLPPAPGQTPPKGGTPGPSTPPSNG